MWFESRLLVQLYVLIWFKSRLLVQLYVFIWFESRLLVQLYVFMWFKSRLLVQLYVFILFESRLLVQLYVFTLSGNQGVFSYCHLFVFKTDSELMETILNDVVNSSIIIDHFNRLITKPCIVLPASSSLLMYMQSNAHPYIITHLCFKTRHNHFHTFLGSLDPVDIIFLTTYFSEEGS